MKRIVHWIILIGLLILFALPLSTHAQDKSVVMPSRTGDITIRRDGKVDVCETWTVQFIGGPFKYARRTIPFNKVEALENWQISENGQAYQNAESGAANTYQVSTESDQQIAIWYFSPTSDQTRTFLVCYTLVGALRIGDEKDEFYWKFIEPDRSYPVEDVQVRLHLPKTFDLNEIEATTYHNGEDARGVKVLDGATVAFTGGRVETQQEWEIRVRFPHGAVDAEPPAWQASAQSKAVQPSTAQPTLLTIKSVIFALGLITVVGLVVSVVIFSRKYRSSEPASAFGMIVKGLNGWPFILLGFFIFMGGTILASSWGLSLYLLFGAIGVGMLTFLTGGVALGQRSGNYSSSDWSGGGSDFSGGGGGGDSGGGGGGGGSDFG